MRRKGRPKKQKAAKVVKVPGKRGRPRKKEIVEDEPPQKKAKRGRPRTIKIEQDANEGSEDPLRLSGSTSQDTTTVTPDDNYSEGLHMSTMQVRALSSLVACLDCGEEVVLGVRPTTKGMISEFTVSCKVCDSQKSTNTPNLIRERKRKREKKGIILQKNENINYAHVSAFLDNGLGYSGLRHYCRYFNARCLNEATFIVYAKQVIADVVAETEDFLQQNARIVRKAFESQIDAESDYIVDLTVGYTTTYHQWGSDFCLVAGAVIELQTGLVLDYDVGNMYCHVCKINAKKIVSMSPAEMTDWFNKHQDTCEIREWCDEIDQDSEEGIKEIDPKYLEAFIAKKMWSRSLNKFGFRYTTLIHESDERIHSELLKAAPYGDLPVVIDNITNCFSRRKSEHARTSFQNKLKAKCPRERVQTKDRIMYVYAMSIPEYNKFAIGSNIKLRELVRRMEIEEEEYQYAAELTIQASEIIPAIRESEEKAAELKEIGDAFELEEEEEDELQIRQPQQSSHKAQQPPMVVEKEENDEDEDDDVEDEEDMEDEEEDDEDEEVVVEECTESKGAVMRDEETIDSKEIEDFEVLEEEEVEIEEEIIDDSANQRMPSTVNASKGNQSSIIIRTESNKRNENIVKKTSDTAAQSLGKRETQITRGKPTVISTEGKAPSEVARRVAPSSSGKVIVSGEKLSCSEDSEKKKSMPSGETQTFIVSKLGASASGGESVAISKAPITIKSSDRAAVPITEKKLKDERVGSIDHKKIVVTTGKKPGSESIAPGNDSSPSESKRRVENQQKFPVSTSGEARKVVPSEDKVKLLVVEKKGIDIKEAEGSRKESHKHEPSTSSSERKEASKTGKPLSENGVEVKSRPPKQPEIKPFRVDFDED